MKLFQLKYYQAACLYLNITRAAEAMHISQPSITNAINELENEFNITLLNRKNRGFSLTEEGHLLLKLANDLIEHSDRLEQTMLDCGKKRKLIRLGVPPMIGTYIFPRIYKGFKDRNPEIKVLTQEDGSQELLESLNKGYLDIVILPTNELNDNTYNIYNFSETETIFCVSTNHKLSTRKYVGINDIKNELLVMFQGGFYQNKVISRLYHNAGFEMQTLHSSSQLQTIIQFIRGGIACGFLFREIALMSDEIVGIPLEPHITMNIGLVWKKDNHMFSDMLKLVEFVRENQEYML